MSYEFDWDKVETLDEESILGKRERETTVWNVVYQAVKNLQNNPECLCNDYGEPSENLKEPRLYYSPLYARFGDYDMFLYI